jgi:hypothetical protein
MQTAPEISECPQILYERIEEADSLVIRLSFYKYSQYLAELQ